MKTKTKVDYCHYNETQVRESGLLSPERMAEVSAAIDARISPCFDAQGIEIPKAKLADCGPTKGRMLFMRFHHDPDMEYMRRDIMAGVLTDAELEMINERCLSERSAAKEAEQFEKAEKVEAWDGGVFFGDTYFSSVDELCDTFEQDGEWAEYAWTATPETVFTGLDVAGVVEDAISNHGWEDMDVNDFHGVSELQAALDKFTEANAAVHSYRPNYKKAVLLAAWKEA